MSKAACKINWYEFGPSMAFIASGATSYIGPFGPIIINTELDMASSVSSEGNIPLELLLDGLLLHACITPVVVSPVAFANCIYDDDDVIIIIIKNI